MSRAASAATPAVHGAVIKLPDAIVTIVPPPTLPWQSTGNHWLAVPCIHPMDGSVHLVGLLHRGARAAVEFGGNAGWTDGRGPALLRPALVVDGERRELADAGMAWERAYGWIPTFACGAGDLAVQGTIFCPYGRDADMPGLVYVLGVENRGSARRQVDCMLEGALGLRQLRVRTARPCDDAHRVTADGDLILLEGSQAPGFVALALGGDAETVVRADADAQTFALTRSVDIDPGDRVEIAFYLAAAPERDGAAATVGALRQRGWRGLLASTRDALGSLEQSTGNEGVDRLVNRNLVLAYFYGVGRALDDAHFYLVRSRAPWNPHGVTSRDWDALMWTIPAIQLGDASLGRELLIRACELHGYAPGRGVNYFDGTLFSPGFSLESAAAYAIATDRYIRDTGDDQIVEEGVVADTLYLVADDLAARRHQRFPLYSTDVEPDGASPPHAFTLHGNAVVANALDVLRRTLDEESSRTLEDPDAVRAAIRRHFAAEAEGKPIFATSTDLASHQSLDDSAAASMFWVPSYEFVARDDSTYRRTARRHAGDRTQLTRECARLFGPDGDETLRWLRRAPLDGGTAAAELDADGRAVAGYGDAALAGLVAYTAWYAAHALGLKG